MVLRLFFQKISCLFLVFSGILIASNISAATLLGSWSFDESDWDSVGTVVDSLGVHDGVVTGSVGRNPVSSATSHAGTCAAAAFGGGAIEVTGLGVTASSYSAYLAFKAFDSSYVEKTSVSFWMYWDGSNSIMPIGFNRHDLWFTGGSFGYNSGSGDIYGIASAGLANGWHHVVAEFTNYDVTNNKLYIDGVSQTLSQRRSTPSVSNAVVNSHLRIGGWWASNGYRFSGLLDEVKIYSGALSPAEVNADYTYTHAGACPADPVPDAPVLIASYNFNDNWSSTQPLEDSVGTASGVVSGSLSRISSPASGLKPDTCYSGGFSGGAIDINSLPVSTASGKQTSISFWMKWDGTNSVMPLGWRRHDLWFYGGSFGFNSAAGDIYGISSAGLSGGWHHVTVVFTNNNAINNQIYIDGVLQTLTQRRGGINNSNSVVNAHLRLGGWWANNGYRFRGELDEVRVFTGTVSQATVDSLLNESCITLLGKWSMDESSWTDTLNEVVDSSGNAYHGTPTNDPTTNNTNSAIGGTPGTCNYGHFDDAGTSNGDYVGLPSFPNLSENFTVTAWINTNNNSAKGQRIFADDEYNNGGFALSLGDGGTGRLRFYSRNINPVVLDGSIGTIQNNTWYFVAAVADISNGTRTIYVYDDSGALIETTTASHTGTWGSDTGISSIGGETNNGETSSRFSGDIDEVQVFSGAMAQATVATFVSEVHSCPLPTGLDHFEFISLPSSGSTCTALNVQIIACSDTNTPCTPYNYSGDVVTSTSSNIGDWSVISGAGGVNTGAANDGSAIYTFTNESSVTLALEHTASSAITLNVKESSSTKNTTSGTITFSDNAFEITEDPITVAGKDQQLTINMVARDPVTGNCATVTGYSGNKDLDWWLAPAAEDPPTAISPTIGGQSLTDTSASAITETVSFVLGVSSVILESTDVGKYALMVRDASGSYASGNIDGASDILTVKPFGIAFDGIVDNSSSANPAGTSAAGGDFISAGTAFTFDIGAYRYQASDDANGDGVPDNGSDITNNGVTQAFAAPTNIAIASYSPAAATLAGSFTPTSIASTTFSGGKAHITSAEYGEVGSIQLQANVTNYLSDATANFTTQSQNIGRFYPDRVIVFGSVDEDALCSDGFIYMGEDALDVDFLIEAQNAHGVRTEHYDNAASYGYLSDIEFVAEDGDNGSTNLASRLSFSNSAVWDKGNMLLSVNNGVFNRDVAVDFVENLQLGLQVTNLGALNDNVNIDNLDINPVQTGSCSSAANCNAKKLLGTVDMRYGRARIENAFGPETHDLPIPLYVEYFNGSSFVLNTDDNCTQYDHLSAGSNSTESPDYTTINPAELMSAGEYNSLIPLNLITPGVAATFNIWWIVDSWLKYNWNGSGDEDPSGTATFGRYRGHDRIIYWRELSN